MAQRLRCADEGEAPLLVLAQDLHVHPRNPVDLGNDLSAVGGLADCGRRHGPGRLGADLLGEAQLRGNHVGDLIDLRGVDRTLVLRGLVDPRVAPLLHHLAELPVLRLGHEHTRGVRADVDGGAEHQWSLHPILSDRTDEPSGCRAEERYGEGCGSTTGSPGCEASSNSRNSPVTTNATCSPTSTALSPIRSIARATSSMVIAHSRRSWSSPISRASWKHSLFRLSMTSSWRTKSRAMSTLRSAKARLACLISARVALPIVTRFLTTRSSAGGSWPAMGISFAMFTHWSPIRSMFFIT